MELETNGGPSLSPSQSRGQSGGQQVRVHLSAFAARRRPGGVRGGFPARAGSVFGVENSLDLLRLGKGRTKQMHLVAPTIHLARQINRLRRSAAGRRIKRFVGKKGDIHNANRLRPEDLELLRSTRARIVVGNPKSQTPPSKEEQNSKLQKRDVRGSGITASSPGRIENWNLVFIWSLDLGIWSFTAGSRQRLQKP